jgi:tRNA(Arg) A34 adenosine deaminase TadA
VPSPRPHDRTHHWIRAAIRLAGEARERGDEPFGALLVSHDRSILEARNAVRTANDVTQHAELRLVSKAWKSLEPEVLANTTLYTSTEPCAMCAGAIYWAGVPRVVYGLAASSLEKMTGGSGLHQPSRRVLGDAAPPVAVEGPVLEDEARLVHEGFWPNSQRER